MWGVSDVEVRELPAYKFAVCIELSVLSHVAYACACLSIFEVLRRIHLTVLFSKFYSGYNSQAQAAKARGAHERTKTKVRDRSPRHAAQGGYGDVPGRSARVWPCAYAWCGGGGRWRGPCGPFAGGGVGVCVGVEDGVRLRV